MEAEVIATLSTSPSELGIILGVPFGWGFEYLSYVDDWP